MAERRFVSEIVYKGNASYLEGGNLINCIEILQSKLDLIPTEYKNDAVIEFYFDRDIEVIKTVIVYNRPETDKEMIARYNKEIIVKEKQEQIDKETYERLKKKFEGGI